MRVQRCVKKESLRRPRVSMNRSPFFYAPPTDGFGLCVVFYSIIALHAICRLLESVGIPKKLAQWQATILLLLRPQTTTRDGEGAYRRLEQTGMLRWNELRRQKAQKSRQRAAVLLASLSPRSRSSAALRPQRTPNFEGCALDGPDRCGIRRR